MSKIRWSNEERSALLGEVKRQHATHPNMRTLDLLRMAQNTVLPDDRKRFITGNDQVAWVQKERDKWIIEAYRPKLAEETVPELPQTKDVELSKSDLMSQLVELLSDAMVQVVAEAVVRARQKLDLPCIDIQPQEVPVKPQLKNIVVYGLIKSQEQQVRKELNGCYNLRFLKDVSQDKLVSGAQWADYVFIMTKFVSHDYEAIKKYKNMRYVSGGVTDLINKLETMYLEENKE